jgi:1-acyl-sn-glycerol-3-phosphate acyltransferase
MSVVPLWRSVRPELHKLLTMLRLFLAHEGTHALGVVLGATTLARWSARNANRNAHIDAFVKSILPGAAADDNSAANRSNAVIIQPNAASSPPSSSPSSSPSPSPSSAPPAPALLDNPSIRLRSATAMATTSMRRATMSLGRNLATMTTRTYRNMQAGSASSGGTGGTTATKAVAAALRQSRSASALQKLLKKSPSNENLCSDCFSRASSHSSLVGLAEEQDEDGGEEDDEEEESADSDDNSPADDARNDRSTMTTRNAHRRRQRCSDVTCAVCARERMTWKSYLKRAVYTLSAGTLTYLLWLRYVAAKETALRHLTALFRVLQKMFSYKVKGASRLPKSGPAVGVIYHGWLPLDMYFLQEYIVTNVRRDCMVMVADFVFQIPFVGWVVRMGGGRPGNKRAALEHLKNGGLLIVAPGGVAEAMTPTRADYKLLWDRSGFAEVARQASAPIYPMFTHNIREVFLVLFGNNSWIKWLYDKTKLPFTPWVGPFLVPLTTFVGKPVAVSSSMTRDQISIKARHALQALMTRRT